MSEMGPEQYRAELQMAKKLFSADILEEDVLFDLIRNVLDDSDLSKDLPNVIIDLWLSDFAADDHPQKLGLIIKQYAEAVSPDQIGILSHNEYIAIADFPDLESIYPADTFIELSNNDIDHIYPAMMAFVGAARKLTRYADDRSEQYVISKDSGSIEYIGDIV